MHSLRSSAQLSSKHRDLRRSFLIGRPLRDTGWCIASTRGGEAECRSCSGDGFLIRQSAVTARQSGFIAGLGWQRRVTFRPKNPLAPSRRTRRRTPVLARGVAPERFAIASGPVNRYKGNALLGECLPGIQRAADQQRAGTCRSAPATVTTVEQASHRRPAASPVAGASVQAEVGKREKRSTGRWRQESANERRQHGLPCPQEYERTVHDASRKQSERSARVAGTIQLRSGQAETSRCIGQGGRGYRRFGEERQTRTSDATGSGIKRITPAEEAAGRGGHGSAYAAMGRHGSRRCAAHNRCGDGGAAGRHRFRISDLHGGAA